MPFNSLTFIICFLPATYLIYRHLRKKSHFQAAMGLLIAASLIYYGWHRPAFLAVLFSSIVVNYMVGRTLREVTRYRKSLLFLGVSFNLAMLVFFKYWTFIVHNIHVFSGAAIDFPAIAMPLAISFFSFQQIAYLVDTARGDTAPCRFPDYVLFVTFFPHLISGPIVRFNETMPQLTDPHRRRLTGENLSVGITMFTLGLFKKVVIADNIDLYVNPVFDAVAMGASVSFFEAWGGTMAYAFRIYFDFSGYSDMAIGVARMFGVFLPLNFNSPFKALNMADFWRRWHITLIRFLRDYLYIPLGGNRKGELRRYANIMITMLLAGIWHGAGWTFTIWGGLHGLMITAARLWQTSRQAIGLNTGPSTFFTRQLAQGTTFLAFVASMAVFRADSLDSAWVLMQTMSGINGIALPLPWEERLGAIGSAISALGVSFKPLPYIESGEYTYLLLLFLFVRLLPNTQEVLGAYQPVLDAEKHRLQEPASRIFHWRPTFVWAMAMSLIFLASLLSLHRQTEFFYFQF